MKLESDKVERMIHVSVRFFAVTRDATGVSETRLELPQDATVSIALETLASKFATLRPHLDRLAVAVNLDYVSRDYELQDGQELALIPPVSGG